MKRKAAVPSSAETCYPKLAHVRIYFDQRGLSPKAADAFYKHYESLSWKTVKGTRISNWKTVANNWIWMHQQRPNAQTLEVKLRLFFPQQQPDTNGR